uniref:Uncharacterized protein n=1 Tax=Lutzomyia longipalpis TaxID=7200 RepID=A0A7G3B6I9_LUTLO
MGNLSTKISVSSLKAERPTCVKRLWPTLLMERILLEGLLLECLEGTSWGWWWWWWQSNWLCLPVIRLWSIAGCYIFNPIACIGQFIECLSFATGVESWTSLQAEEVPLTIMRRTEETCLTLPETLNTSFRWTREPKEGFSIAIRHLIGPIAAICCSIEC